MIGAGHTKLEEFVRLARARRPKAYSSVERLKAACQLEAPHFDAELVELISHVVVRTETPPRSIVRVAALRRQSRVLQKRLSTLLRRKSR